MAPKLASALAEYLKPNGGIFNWEISWKTLAGNRYNNEFSNFLEEFWAMEGYYPGKFPLANRYIHEPKRIL